MVLQHYKKGVYNGKFKTLRDCETPVSKFETQTSKNLRLQDAKVSENETSRPITNASEISRSGKKFPGPTYFKEPFYIP